MINETLAEKGRPRDDRKVAGKQHEIVVTQ